jgi:hypothetical protein
LTSYDIVKPPRLEAESMMGAIVRLIICMMTASQLGFVTRATIIKAIIDDNDFAGDNKESHSSQAASKVLADIKEQRDLLVSYWKGNNPDNQAHRHIVERPTNSQSRYLPKYGRRYPDYLSQSYMHETTIMIQTAMMLYRPIGNTEKTKRASQTTNIKMTSIASQARVMSIIHLSKAKARAHMAPRASHEAKANLHLMAKGSLLQKEKQSRNSSA